MHIICFFHFYSFSLIIFFDPSAYNSYNYLSMCMLVCRMLMLFSTQDTESSNSGRGLISHPTQNWGHSCRSWDVGQLTVSLGFTRHTACPLFIVVNLSAHSRSRITEESHIYKSLCLFIHSVSRPSSFP